jgi:signal transduction histidine kinase
MDSEALFRRYQELQAYVGWTDADARQIQSVAMLLEPFLPALVDDFYAEIEKHPDARKVITGGEEQIRRLKGTLLNWLHELLAGAYGAEYVARRWRVGSRHVEIGLDQVFTNVALSRLRGGLLQSLEQCWPRSASELLAVRKALNTLIDLDLAIIEDAYQAAFVARQQRLDRLATLGQFAGGVAHELRNPLNVVRTSVYYLLNASNPTPEKQAEHLKRIESQVVLADGVITALSRFTKMPMPDARPVPAAQCLCEALEANPVPASVTVLVDADETLQALGDREQLRIILGNLIRNAGEAMPEGGQLTLAARPAGDHVELSVVDTGTGIPAEDLHRIMEPLYSTKTRGLGLGLAIARALLEKNGGSLRVSSEPGKGSTFSLLLRAVATTEGGGRPSGGFRQASTHPTRPPTPK